MRSKWLVPWVLLFCTLYVSALAHKREVRIGFVTWYGVWHKKGDHRFTANHERFNRNALTCASRTLPFNTKLKVVDRRTGRSIIVRVNDRMGAHKPLIDLTLGAAKRLGFAKRGTEEVKLIRLQ